MNTAMTKLLDIISDTVNSVDSQLKDGFQPTDLFALIPLAASIPAVIAEKEAISIAWKGRSSTDLNEWLAYMKEKINLVSDDAEVKAEAVLTLAVAAIDVFDTFKKSAA